MSDWPQSDGAAHRTWRICRSEGVRLDRPRLMGILNITPDSFSDGGAYADAEEAAAAGLGMIEQGAALIDVGGESTRPGAQPVHEREQIRRVGPVIAALRARPAADRCAISIDTTSAAVARAAIEAGADVINDVSAGVDDPAMLALAASSRAGIILMHRRRTPRDDAFSTDYAREPDYGGGVFAAVSAFLRARINAALDAGVAREAIIVDPGLGFGKSVAQNYELAARLGELQRDLDSPALSAASRKSFLARPPGAPPIDPMPTPLSPERLAAGVAITLSHWRQGVRLFRVHDVGAHARALAAAAALNGEQSRRAGG